MGVHVAARARDAMGRYDLDAGRGAAGHRSPRADRLEVSGPHPQRSYGMFPRAPLAAWYVVCYVALELKD